MFLYPLDQFFLEKHPLLADLVRGQPLAYQFVQCLVADSEEFLSLRKGEEYSFRVPRLLCFFRHLMPPLWTELESMLSTGTLLGTS